jgi:hypothetical protein
MKISKLGSALAFCLALSAGSALKAATCPAGGEAPTAPTNLAQVQVMEGNVKWAAPTDIGGSSITGYNPVTSLDNGVSWTKGVAMQATAALKGYITEKSGTVVLVKVTAQNVCGTSPATPILVWVAP